MENWSLLHYSLKLLTITCLCVASSLFLLNQYITDININQLNNNHYNLNSLGQITQNSGNYITESYKALQAFKLRALKGNKFFIRDIYYILSLPAEIVAFARESFVVNDHQELNWHSPLAHQISELNHTDSALMHQGISDLHNEIHTSNLYPFACRDKYIFSFKNDVSCAIHENIINLLEKDRIQELFNKPILRSNTSEEIEKFLSEFLDRYRKFRKHKGSNQFFGRCNIFLNHSNYTSQGHNHDHLILCSGQYVGSKTIPRSLTYIARVLWEELILKKIHGRDYPVLNLPLGMKISNFTSREIFTRQFIKHYDYPVGNLEIKILDVAKNMQVLAISVQPKPSKKDKKAAKLPTYTLLQHVHFEDLHMVSEIGLGKLLSEYIATPHMQFYLNNF